MILTTTPGEGAANRRAFSQPELVGAILLWIDERGVKTLNPRQLNAVARAATDIIAELDSPDRPATPDMGLRAWLASDDTGQSSRYLVRALAPFAGLGYPNPTVDSREPWPHDPADFGRCVRLLDAVSELRPQLHRLAEPEHGRVWNALAAEWGVLEAWYREDLPTGRSERLMTRITELKAVQS